MSQASGPPVAAITARISSRSCGVTRSSASIARTQGRVASARARFFCGPNPGQSGAWCTCAPAARAMSGVASVLALSTTMTSAANETEARHSRMRASSLRVMMMALSSAVPGAPADSLDNPRMKFDYARAPHRA